MAETPVDWMIADGTATAQTASAREGDLGRSALKTGARKGRSALATTPTAKTDAMKGAPAGTPVVRRTISRKILYARYRPPKSSWGRLILGGCVVGILRWYSRLGSLASWQTPLLVGGEPRTSDRVEHARLGREVGELRGNLRRLLDRRWCLADPAGEPAERPGVELAELSLAISGRNRSEHLTGGGVDVTDINFEVVEESYPNGPNQWVATIRNTATGAPTLKVAAKAFAMCASP